MRLRTGRTRAEIPAAPAASLALLLVLLVGLSSVSSLQRGLLIRLPGRSAGVGLPDPGGALFLSLLPDGSLVLDGEAVAAERLLSRLESRLGRNASRPVVLRVSGDAPYGAMAAVVDLLAGGGTSSGFRVRRLFVPTHAELMEWTRALGHDPFDRAPGGGSGGQP
jgi:biopolymer transport protein ExbD